MTSAKVRLPMAWKATTSLFDRLNVLPLRIHAQVLPTL
jgi:hypothetical protein